MRWRALAAGILFLALVGAAGYLLWRERQPPRARLVWAEAGVPQAAFQALTLREG